MKELTRRVILTVFKVAGELHIDLTNNSFTLPVSHCSEVKELNGPKSVGVGPPIVENKTGNTNVYTEKTHLSGFAVTCLRDTTVFLGEKNLACSSQSEWDWVKVAQVIRGMPAKDRHKTMLDGVLCNVATRVTARLHWVDP